MLDLSFSGKRSLRPDRKVQAHNAPGIATIYLSGSSASLIEETSCRMTSEYCHSARKPTRTTSDSMLITKNRSVSSSGFISASYHVQYLHDGNVCPLLSPDRKVRVPSRRENSFAFQTSGLQLPLHHAPTTRPEPYPSAAISIAASAIATSPFGSYSGLRRMDVTNVLMEVDSPPP